MGAHSALTREDEDRNLGAVPHGSMAKLVKAADCKSVIARSNRAGTSTMPLLFPEENKGALCASG